MLLGASLIIAFAAVLDALGVVDFRAADKAAGWVFVDAMWRAVLYFLPIMVAYNASKKLNVDPWVGATIMAALFTPEFISLSDPTAIADHRLHHQPDAGHRLVRRQHLRPADAAERLRRPGVRAADHGRGARRWSTSC